MSTKKTIYIFGNPLLEIDSLPIKLIPDLSKKYTNIEFKKIDPNENLKPDKKELTIIDTVINTDKVRILTDIDKISQNSLYTAHDLDLGFNLKLLKKIGQLDKVTIFCVPPNISKKEALKQLEPLLSKYV